MNKQFDLFQKMKIKEVCENISRMTYAYINPDTKQPTVVPSKHYKDIIDNIGDTCDIIENIKPVYNFKASENG